MDAMKNDGPRVVLKMPPLREVVIELKRLLQVPYIGK